MEDKSLEAAFQKIKEEMPVNTELKKTLRQNFIKPRKNAWAKRLSIFAAAAVILVALFSSYLLTPESVIQKANAASLRISNFLSFVEIAMGEGIGVSEYQGTVYVPVPDKGVYTYNESGFKKILGKEMAGFVRVSQDGTKLAISSSGSVSIYDLNKKTLQKVLQYDEKQSVYYEEPSWSPDGKRIIYTKAVFKPGQTHGFTREDEIYVLDLETMRSTKLANGSHAVMTKDGKGILFEKGQKIVFKDLKSEVEKILDSGRFPSISPDGNYVAYIKNEVNEREVAPYAKVTETISNVWIADAVDFKTKKRVTSNFPKQFMDVNQWVKTLKPSTVPQVLQFSGQYDYYEPVWSSTSQSLYVVRNLNEESGGGMKLVRIDFSTEKPSPHDVVRKFLQALVVRDDDFAKSLMKNPPEILTVSNPHNVGYKVVGSGKEGSKIYVDAEIYSAYTANPAYYYSRARFWLSEKENGYIIDKADFKDKLDVIADDGKGEVSITQNQSKTVLFSNADIPASYMFKGEQRFASLAYNKKSDTLFFTLQALQEVGQNSSVRLLSYNLKTKEFRLLTDVSRIDNFINIGVANLVVDSEGKYAALDLFSDDDKAFNSHTYVYDVENGKGINMSSLFADGVESVHTAFWEDAYLVLEAKADDQTMRYKYNPEEAKLEAF